MSRPLKPRVVDVDVELVARLLRRNTTWRRGDSGRWPLMASLVLDMGVLVEYVVPRTPYGPRIARLFEAASAGKLKLYVSADTTYRASLRETYSEKERGYRQ